MKLLNMLQKVIKESNAKFSEKHGEAWDADDKAGLAFFKSKDDQVVSLSDAESAKWKKEVTPVIDDYIKKASIKGVDRQAVCRFYQISDVIYGWTFISKLYNGRPGVLQTGHL